MSMAEMMQPVYQEYVQQARDNLNGEMLQAWVATQHVGANDVIAIAPNREETTLTDYELRYAIYQRLGLLEHVLELDRFASPTGKCLACNRPNITAAHFSNCGHSCKEKHDLLVRLHHDLLETAGVNARVELQVPNAQRKIDIFYQDPKPNSIHQEHHGRPHRHPSLPTRSHHHSRHHSIAENGIKGQDKQV